MTEEAGSSGNRASRPWILAMVNVGIWAISLISMVFLMRHCPGVRKLYPILAGGTVVGIVLFSMLLKSR